MAVVCFAAALIEYGPPFNPTERMPLSLEILQESDIHFYTFPAPRLEVIESPATGLPATATVTEDDKSSPDLAPTLGDETRVTP